MNRRTFLQALAVLLVCCVGAGCNPEKSVDSYYDWVDEQSYRQEEPRQLAGRIRYTHDDDTGICFALIQKFSESAREVLTITAVPCTPEVLKAIDVDGRK